jgi:2-amino-4-hydroxy-6-hydroxymethyldihydropteridine diphosphokinase
VNACALVETTLAPRALLDQLLALEKRHGRVRTIPNGPRTLDLDIVLYGDSAIDEPGSRSRIRARTSGVRARAARRGLAEALIPARQAAELLARL